MIRFPLFQKSGLLSLSTLLVFLISWASLAQDEASTPDPEPEATAADPPATDDSVEAAQQKEIEQLRSDLDELRQRMDAADEERLAEMGSGEFEPSLDVYGFMAFYAGKWFIDEDNVMHGIMHNKLTFGITDLNVYFSGHMTETLSSLVELRFTFLPHGADASYLPSYDRVSNSYVDSNTSEELTLGGVIIERAKMTWQPYDFFGVSVGRFLTPFGIWNIDHGAPVVIPINKPYLMLRHLMPLNQTGFMVHGRFYPASNTYFDYAVTLSNGRGPTEEVYDLDDNKAVGLRLRILYEGTDVEFALGMYGFFGHTTDVTKVPSFGSDEGGGTSDFQLEEEILERYQELAGSADLLLKLWNFRVQSEWAGGYLKYKERPLSVVPIVLVESPTGEYQPDYLRYNFYAMLAYDFPLGKGDNIKWLTLYGMVEHDVMYDSLPEYDTWLGRGGLNFRPNAFVVLKLDATYVTLPNSKDIGDIWSIGGQVAFSF